MNHNIILEQNKVIFNPLPGHQIIISQDKDYGGDPMIRVYKNNVDITDVLLPGKSKEPMPIYGTLQNLTSVWKAIKALDKIF